MDDVDRLFECFKCGVSPPQSALRVRKKSRNKIDNGNVDSTKQDTKFSGFSTPGSSRQRLKNAADMQLCMEKLGSTEINPLKKKVNTGKKQISPVVFYGSPRGLPTKRPRRLLQLLFEIHNDLSEGNELNSRKEIWATFPKQDQAIVFVAKSHSHVRLFSYQDHLNGQRRFLVSTYREFWRRYKNMHSRFRHHYEVIQDGLPCHLYFDLEFNKKFNTNKNGEEMVDVLISVTLEALFDKYSIQGNQDWIVELDSSTEEKFSRHLVIRIPKTAFKDNLHAGAFVTEICSRICSARESDPRLEKLFVSKDSCSGEFPAQLFIDTGVYSRNRCFRLALSSKAGKSSVLLPTGRFKCKNMCEEAMFMESLICKMDDDCQKLLICKTDTECMKTLYFNSEVNSNFEDQSSAPQHKLSLEACFSNMPTTYLMGKSPFPALDVFVESIASTGNVSGRIRSWYWFSDYGLMVYSMLRNRYCERIGREHKSNHVMYIVDFKRAVYYQKCYDPDCKGYRSPIRQIPWDVIPDTLPFLNPSHTGHYSSMTDAVDHQDDSNHVDQMITLNDKKNDWWHEAIRIADDVENRRVQEPAKLEMVDDEDHDWWMAVEKTASQAEQQSMSQLLDVT